jgi:hypothetical protein
MPAAKVSKPVEAPASVTAPVPAVVVVYFKRSLKIKAIVN